MQLELHSSWFVNQCALVYLPHIYFFYYYFLIISSRLLHLLHLNEETYKP